jgi:hypothetical protein
MGQQRRSSCRTTLELGHDRSNLLGRERVERVGGVEGGELSEVLDLDAEGDQHITRLGRFKRHGAAPYQYATPWR